MVQKIKSKDRLIVALDFDNIQKAKNLVEELADQVTFYKIGLELMMGSQYFELIKWLEQKNKKVFADLKLFDISNTVYKAIKNLNQYSNIEFLTIHTASKDIMQKAVAAKGNIKLLGVTVLTNIDKSDLNEMGFAQELSLSDLVIKKAKLAQECGVDGVISSALESSLIKKNTHDNFLVITPGIRPDFLKNNSDDQKRIVDVKTAIKNGSDYIVVGRPISKNPYPKEVARKIGEQIREAIL